MIIKEAMIPKKFGFGTKTKKIKVGGVDIGGGLLGEGGSPSSKGPAAPVQEGKDDFVAIRLDPNSQRGVSRVHRKLSVKFV